MRVDLNMPEKLCCVLLPEKNNTTINHANLGHCGQQVFVIHYPAM
jgi:hypothetical protein